VRRFIRAKEQTKESEKIVYNFTSIPNFIL